MEIALPGEGKGGDMRNLKQKLKTAYPRTVLQWNLWEQSEQKFHCQEKGQEWDMQNLK